MTKCNDIPYLLLNNSFKYNLTETDFQFLLDDYCNTTQRQKSFITEITMTTAVIMTAVYVVLLVSGVAGNVFTCAVISRNSYMHTATNCYLFSLTISDLLLLITGIPHEIHMLWMPQPPYSLGEVVCVFRGFTAEASAYASVLTITCFTVERYLAICHPLKAHAISRPSRSIKIAVLVWVLAATSALPVAMQFGLIHQQDNDGEIIPDSSVCALKRPFTKHAFLISAVIFFCFPLVLIFVLYVKIGLKLRKPLVVAKCKENGQLSFMDKSERHSGSNRQGIIKMLSKYSFKFFVETVCFK